MTECNLYLADEGATARAGQHLATAVGALPVPPPALVIYLCGQLGAGKTAMCRAFLQGLGHKGPVKSPTYTLVEPYHLGNEAIYHFDLYRLKDPQELEYLGVDEYFQQGNCCLVEWPERGQGMVPPADVVLSLQHENGGRRLQVQGVSERGKKVTEAFCPLLK